MRLVYIFNYTEHYGYVARVPKALAWAVVRVAKHKPWDYLANLDKAHV